MTIEYIRAGAAIAPFSPAVRVDGLLFVSGQIPLDPSTGQFVAGGIEEQTRQVLDNLRTVLETAGSDLSRVVKTTVLLGDIADYEAMNTVYATYFGENLPARTTYAVGLYKNFKIEIDAVAVA